VAFWAADPDAADVGGSGRVLVLVRAAGAEAGLAELLRAAATSWQPPGGAGRGAQLLHDACARCDALPAGPPGAFDGAVRMVLCAGELSREALTACRAAGTDPACGGSSVLLGSAAGADGRDRGSAAFPGHIAAALQAPSGAVCSCGAACTAEVPQPAPSGLTPGIRRWRLLTIPQWAAALEAGLLEEELQRGRVVNTALSSPHRAG